MITKRYGITALLITFLLILLPSFSHSNDTLVADYGKTVGPIKTNEIRMVEEEVTIRVDDYIDMKSAVFPLRRAHVKCTFLFKNTSDKLIEATVGFPGNEQSTGLRYSEPITDFVAAIDAQRFKVNIKREILKEDRKDNFQVFRNWYTWDMKFPANSTVKVENTCLYFLSAPSGYEPFYLHYELSTGGNWKGKIGRATIKVIYKDREDLEKRICEIKPKGWVRKQNEILWNLRNIKPTQADNISVCERNLGVDYPESERKPLSFRRK